MSCTPLRVVVVEQLDELVLGVPDAGQVCHGRVLVLAVEVHHQVTGAVPGGAAGAVGDRHERQVDDVELLDGARQQRLARLGLGREVLDAQRRPGPGLQAVVQLAHAPAPPSAARSAASSVLSNKKALVMAPTPPMRGDSQPATLGDIVGHVAGELAVDEAHSRRDDRRTRSHHVGGDQPGSAGRGDDDVGGAGVGADVVDPGVHDGHRCVRPGVLERQQVGERTTDREPPADDDDVLAGDGDVVGVQHVHDAAGGARDRCVLAHDQQAQVDGVQAVRVLGGVDPQQRPSVVEVARERVLHDERVDRRIRVELVDDGVHLVLGGRAREASVDRGHADLGAVAVLHAHVLGAGSVVADQDRAETRGDAALGERGDAGGHVGLELRGEAVAVQGDRSHRRRW
jgi:hypothetical protein